MTTDICFNVFAFINEKILRNHRENSIVRRGTANILAANVIHQLKHKLKRWIKLKLIYPNDMLQFPLPNRWSNPNETQSKQQLYMVIKQLAINLKEAGHQQRQQILTSEDICERAIQVMKIFSTYHLGQIENVTNIKDKFNLLRDVEYLPERELLFADSVVNGEASYMLRKYGVEYYELTKSKIIDENYRKAFQNALKTEIWNQNSEKFGLSQKDIIRRVTDQDGVYAMLYEHYEDVSQGDVITNIPKIYVQNTELKEMHYLHICYPIFLRIKTSENSYGFICIAIGVRIKKQVKIFSPFFANQGERVWRLAQSHLGQLIINDFSVRQHLGIYHFTTNQYHVPIYNYLQQLSQQKSHQHQNFQGFLDHTYSLFSHGLQGVNVSATAFLVHPQPEVSLVNKALNVRQDHAISIIASTSNNLKIFEYDPVTIMKNQGISENQIKTYFQKMSFDFQLYSILSEYIEGLFKAFQIDNLTENLKNQINKQTENMKVGSGSPHSRPPLRNAADVLTTIKNLCFCWVGFHSHTFSEISFATYALLRPAMLKKSLPSNQKDWEKVQIGQQLPDPKMIMETGKLNEGTTQRDSDNFLMDTIRRQAQQGAYLSGKYKNELIGKAYNQLQNIASNTLKKLYQYEGKILQVNRKRREQGSISFEWMLPSSIQASLNI